MIHRKWTNKDPRQQFDKILGIALEKIGVVVLGQAKLLAPIQSGRLAGSLTYATRRSRSGITAPATGNDAIDKPTVNNEVWVGTNVEYAPHVEYGTKSHMINSAVNIPKVGWRYIGMHPGTQKQPYLRPALKETRKDITRIFKETIGSEYGK